MAYKTKQILPFRARLTVVYRVQSRGRWGTFQTGHGWGNPSQDLEAMFDSAKLQAQYKHMGLNGRQYKSPNDIYSMEIENHFFEYQAGKETYTYQTIKYKSKGKDTKNRYVVARRKGKIVSRTKFTYSKKDIKEKYEF